MISNKGLIEMAVSVVRPKKDGDFFSGDVGCALVTDKGNVYLGVCIDTSSGMGFCAEHNAVGSMITAGEYRIKKIVAVWKDKKSGGVCIFSPCGRCREFMYQIINKKNIDVEVIMEDNKTVKLKELLPYAGWDCKLKK